MKLLDRTLRTYLLYSALVMLVSTPVFYIIIERLFIEDVDEALLIRKGDIQRRLGEFPSQQALMNWHDAVGNTFFLPIGPRTPKQDSIYDAEYPEIIDPFTTESEPFRELATRLNYQGQPFQLITRISLVESEDLLQTIVLAQIALLALLLLGLLWLNRRTARKLWHPFYETLAQLRQYRIDESRPLILPVSDITEFAELNQTISGLTRRSHQAFIDQKEFTENAAHEMQTPVAIFQTKLERLVQTQPLTNEQTALLGSLNGVTARLSRLNKSLLLLAGIDNQAHADPEPVHLTDLLNGLIDQSIETVIAKQIELVRTGFEEGVRLQINRTLLDTLLSNLLTNAIRYTPTNGRIVIGIQPQVVSIANTGEPLTITQAQLFARFGKGEAQTGGVGLGLAIAQKIADTCGYSLTYQYTNGQHQFVLWFG